MLGFQITNKKTKTIVFIAGIVLITIGIVLF